MNIIGILITVLVAALVYVLLVALTGSTIVAHRRPRSWSCSAGIPSGGFGFGAAYGGARRRRRRARQARAGSRRSDSNRRPALYKAAALPAELLRRRSAESRPRRRPSRCSRGRSTTRARGGSSSALGVQAPLELAEDEPEQHVAPGGLGEGAAVAAQGRELVARGVVAVDQPAERPQREVLGQRHGRPRGRRGARAGTAAAARRRRRRAPRWPRAAPARRPASASPRVTSLPSSSTSS